MYLHIFTYTHIHMQIYICRNTCVYIYIHTCIHIYIYINVTAAFLWDQAGATSEPKGSLGPKLHGCPGYAPASVVTCGPNYLWF